MPWSTILLIVFFVWGNVVQWLVQGVWIKRVWVYKRQAWTDEKRDFWNNKIKRKSGCCRAVVTLYMVVQSWLIDKQAKRMQPAQVAVGEAAITWPGAGRCRRTIADVDEPSKKCQLFISGVPCVRLLSDDKDWDSESWRRSSTQGAAKQLFPIMARRDPRKSQNSFD